VGGAWVFRGTRLPVATVIENLQDLSVDEVIEQFAAIAVTLATYRIRRLDPWVTLRRIQGLSDCAHDFRRAHA
jgi:Protein of unknown function (DUF433)